MKRVQARPLQVRFFMGSKTTGVFQQAAPYKVMQERLPYLGAGGQVTKSRSRFSFGKFELFCLFVALVERVGAGWLVLVAKQPLV